MSPLALLPTDLAARDNAARRTLFTNVEGPVWRDGPVIFLAEDRLRVTYNGVRMRPDPHALVWRHLLDYARAGVGDDGAVTFGMIDLLIRLNWGLTEHDHERLCQVLSCFKACELFVDNLAFGHGVGVSLLREYAVFGVLRLQCKVWLQPGIVEVCERLGLAPAAAG